LVEISGGGEEHHERTAKDFREALLAVGVISCGN